MVEQRNKWINSASLAQLAPSKPSRFALAYTRQLSQFNGHKFVRNSHLLVALPSTRLAWFPLQGIRA